MKNVGWISADMQSRIKPLPISLIMLEVNDDSTTHTIKVEMQKNISSAESKTNNININTFDDGQPKEFLLLFRNFKIAIDGTGTTTTSGQINYIRTMLCGQAFVGIQ